MFMRALKIDRHKHLTNPNQMWFFGSNASAVVLLAVPHPSTTSDPIDTSQPLDWVLFQFIDQLADAIWEQSEYALRSQFQWNRVAGIIRYCCLIYGVTCLVMALVLNRTYVIVSTNNTRNQQAELQRQRLGLEDDAGEENAPMVVDWTARCHWFFQTLRYWRAKYALPKQLKHFAMVGFRLAVIGVLLYDVFHILMAFNLMGHLQLPLAFWWLPDSVFAYHASNYDSRSYMATPPAQVMVGPTTNMYWPIFLSFCLSLFAETFLLVIDGKKPYTELGITIFEHSLAFQEFSSNGAFIFGGDTGVADFHKRPTEQVLAAALFSICNHLNIHIGALVNGNRWRLVPLTVFGVAFLGYFFKEVINGHLWRFPIILVVTFVPQMLIVGLVGVSVIIFALAVCVNGFKLSNLNYALFLLVGDEDGPQFDIHWHDDFYTALLSLGLLSITLAGKSSYITELSLVNMDDETWLDRQVHQVGRRELIANYLHRNRVSGYENLIAVPTKRMIAGDEGVDTGRGNGSNSVINRRASLVALMTRDALDLVWCLLRDMVLFVIHRGRSPHSPRVPRFLQRYVEVKADQVDDPPATFEEDGVNIDNLTEEELAQNYVELLAGANWLNIDTSPNYIGDATSESDWEALDDEENLTPLSEVITADTVNEASTSSSIMSIHFNHGRVTRSRFARISSEKGPTLGTDMTQKFVEVLLEKRRELPPSHEDSRLDCVICHVNPREIITWPCKCFAICEGCRLLLVSKGIEGCVCCRRDVEGVSKVFIP